MYQVDLEEKRKELVTVFEEFQGLFMKSLNKVFRIGELLIETKGELKRGTFTSWVEENLPFGAKQAQNYMLIYRHKVAIEESKREKLTFNDSLSIARSAKKFESDEEYLEIEPELIQQEQEAKKDKESAVNDSSSSVSDTSNTKCEASLSVNGPSTTVESKPDIEIDGNVLSVNGFPFITVNDKFNSVVCESLLIEISDNVLPEFYVEIGHDFKVRHEPDTTSVLGDMIDEEITGEDMKNEDIHYGNFIDDRDELEYEDSSEDEVIQKIIGVSNL